MSVISPPAHTVGVLASREDFREQYGRQRDPIYEDRLLWRAQSFRHIVHLMPGQSILELGAGDALFTRKLLRVSRSRNPVTAVTFRPGRHTLPASDSNLEFLKADSLPGPLEGRTFDLIVAMDLLDERNSEWFLESVRQLLKPGGQAVFYQSNPWNVVLKLRRLIGHFRNRRDTRALLNMPQLYEAMSRAGFTRVLAVYNDFVYSPLNRPMIWLLRNLSIILENLPAVRTLAGSILVSAQKPGPAPELLDIPLCEHENLEHAVSVVIPCHNEEMNLRPLVSRLLALYGGYIHEIILVDDNSTDETANTIRLISSEHPVVKGVFRRPPNGVGLALRDGYALASGRYVLSMDCDFLHLLPEIRDLFDAAAQGYDVVIGSRFSRHSVLLNYPFQKILANRGFHALALIVFHRRFRDLTNNLKLLRIEVVRALKLSEPHFAVNAETGLQPLLMGFSVHEVPISWINRTPEMGMSSFRLAKVGGGYWRVLASLAIKTRFGFRPLSRARKAGR